MRVIAGEFRSRRLESIPGDATRPTPDRVREALFNILPRIEGATFLDAYAGTGAVGIEALSRGARHAFFLEKNRGPFLNSGLWNSERRAPVHLAPAGGFGNWTGAGGPVSLVSARRLVKKVFAGAGTTGGNQPGACGSRRPHSVQAGRCLWPTLAAHGGREAKTGLSSQVWEPGVLV